MIDSVTVKQIQDCHLYTFIDGAYLNDRQPEDVARALVDGGSDIIQLRMKNASAEEMIHIAERVHPITLAAGVPLVINDHIDAALAVGAEYIHLGQEDFFDGGYHTVQDVFQGKTVSGGLPHVGLSSHAPAQALRAVDAGAVYLGVGPVFATRTKPQAVPVTLEYVRWASENIRIPWFAIGSVNLSNLEQVMEAGARRVCAVSDILNAPDIAGRCREYKKILSHFE